MSVLIKGGHIVTAADDYVADILVEGETVAEIGRSLDVSADRVIDASGKYVIPGAIDPHTHMEMPFGGTVTCDDFTSGTTSAAFGGITSLIDFCLQAPGQSIPDALATWHEKIERCPPVIDVGFHSRSPTCTTAASSRTWPRPPTRASPATSCSWPTRARSWSTTRRCFESCRSRPRPARW